MGFGTSSSAATMPMTMQCASEYGCRESLVKFVIPLGTNINRDGAALYEAVSPSSSSRRRAAPRAARERMARLPWASRAVHKAPS